MSFSFKKYEPTGATKEVIKFYYTMNSGSDEATSSFLSNYPHGTMDILFVLSGGIHVKTLDSDQENGPGIIVIAQQEANFKIRIDPGTRIVGVVFKAEAFPKIFNFPLKELTNAWTDITDHVDTDYLMLIEQLNNIADGGKQIQQVERFLGKQLAQHNVSFDEFDNLIQHVRDQFGSVSIEELAYHAIMSMRTLQRKMNNRLGLSPKSYSRIIRFNYSMLLIKEYPDLDWHDVLFKCGYFDQMHFIKDFKQYTGQSPGAFVKTNTELSDFFREK